MVWGSCTESQTLSSLLAPQIWISIALMQKWRNSSVNTHYNSFVLSDWYQLYQLYNGDSAGGAPIARFMGPTWDHLGPTGPRWAPCWPHELCYLGVYAVKLAIRSEDFLFSPALLFYLLDSNFTLLTLYTVKVWLHYHTVTILQTQSVVLETQVGNQF